MLIPIAALALASASVTAAQAAPAAPAAAPQLTAAQAAALRCSVVFARGARMQADRDPAAAQWPVLAQRGREYFVRVLARLSDDTGATRETLAAMAAREAAAMQAPAAVAAAMPACLTLLDASGV